MNPNKIISIEEGLSFISLEGMSNRKTKTFGTIKGKRVRNNTLKLKTYLLKGCSCYYCGKEAEFFAVIKRKKQPAFLEMFRVENKKWIPYSKDHIRPLSKGGAVSKLANLQTMCDPCNRIKGNGLW